MHLREYAEAIGECRRALGLNAAYWYVYPDLVVAYRATGQLDQSKQALSEFIPDTPGLHGGGISATRLQLVTKSAIPKAVHGNNLGWSETGRSKRTVNG